MANWEHCPYVERIPGQVGGAWAFRGTDVPLYRLYESLASGDTVDDFAARFGVAVEQAAAALEFEADELHDYRLDYPDGAPFARAPERKDAAGADDALWQTCPDVEQDAGRLGGAWVFKNSRLTLYTLHGNLAAGATVADFVEWYDGVDKRKAITVLMYEAKTLRENRPVYVDTV